LLESADCKSNSDSNSTSRSAESGEPLAVIHELTVYRKKSRDDSSRFHRKARICSDNEFKQTDRNDIAYMQAAKPNRPLSVISPSISSSSKNKISAHHQLCKLRSIQSSKKKKSISLSPKRNSRNNTINVRLNKQTPFTTKKNLNLKKRRIVPNTIGVNGNQKTTQPPRQAEGTEEAGEGMCLDPNSVRFCQAIIEDYRCRFTKKRKITPSLIEECNFQAAPPAKKQRRVVAPQVIGKCSKSSIDARNKLNTYFNATNNQMFNEQDFEKYTAQQNMNHYLGYAIIEEEHTAPAMAMNEEEEKEKENESDMSINSNPGGTNSYRRKMIKNRVTNQDNKLASAEKKQSSNKKAKKKKRMTTTPSKITDYFPTVTSATNISQ